MKDLPVSSPAPAVVPTPGWRRSGTAPSLPESNSTVIVPGNAGFWRKMLAFAGPGLMVAVGYMDPGNWSTDLAAGAKFGYALLSVVLISNFIAILLQHLALKLGVAADRDLAQACRDHYSRPVAVLLWVLCEVAIIACDLAEVIGSAIALNLLFGLPLVVGVLVTALDVLLVLFFQRRGFRYIEALVAALIGIIALCFGYQMIMAQPVVRDLLGGLVPQLQVVVHPEMLYLAIGILGATVMPHNLYLHSSIVQTRAYERNPEGKRAAIRFATIDSTVALLLAFFINAAILVVSASQFHGTAHEGVADISDAYQLLIPTLGSMAGFCFAIALLAAGMNSTLTGTMAGQIVMEGFLDLRLRPWVRRMITRLLAIVPAALVAAYFGQAGVGKLLILSQVVLSLQLGFAVVPLVLFTSDRRKMGEFVNAFWLTALAWLATVVIVALNAWLLWQTVAGWIHPALPGS